MISHNGVFAPISLLLKKMNPKKNNSKNRITTALLLAAGTGSRLLPLTRRTKVPDSCQ